MHGHTFSIRLVVRGPIHPVAGWVMDFADIHAAWAPVYAELDHRVLNEIDGLDNPTSENVALYIWRALRETLPALAAVEVSETGGFRVMYRGD